MIEMTVDDIPRLSQQARARLPAGDMTIDEFYEWMQTLPEDEATAVMCELAEMSAREPD